jgi:hypothetical protein
MVRRLCRRTITPLDTPLPARSKDNEDRLRRRAAPKDRKAIKSPHIVAISQQS